MFFFGLPITSLGKLSTQVFTDSICFYYFASGFCSEQHNATLTNGGFHNSITILNRLQLPRVIVVVTCNTVLGHISAEAAGGNESRLTEQA